MFNVLVVEDEEIIRKGLIYSTDWLKYDCQVIDEASNGIQGVEKILKLKPDIVIFDINMPMKNGLEMLEETYNKHSFSSIIISGYDDFEYAKKAIDYNVTGYLLKPIDEDELIKALEKAKNKLKVSRKYLNIMDNLVDLNAYFKDDIYEQNINYSKTTNQIIDYIQKNYKEKITNNTFMDITAMGKTYINSTFKKDTGKTITSFINEYRILKSTIYLIETDETIQNIAEKVGFCDYRYYIEVFKKYTNSTPSEFVKKLKFNKK